MPSHMMMISVLAFLSSDLNNCACVVSKFMASTQTRTELRSLWGLMSPLATSNSFSSWSSSLNIINYHCFNIMSCGSYSTQSWSPSVNPLNKPQMCLISNLSASSCSMREFIITSCVSNLNSCDSSG